MNKHPARTHLAGSSTQSCVELNDSWTFCDGFAPDAVDEPCIGETVSLPHTAVEVPYNYFDERCYQRIFTYQRVLSWSNEFEGREVSLQFDGAMADAVVYLNGQQVAAHKDGYTPFEARLTGLLRDGENLVTVKVDGSENPDIPPFGGQIDYLTYAGIYRDVWLKTTAPVFLRNLKIETQNALSESKAVSVRCDLANPQDLEIDGIVTVSLFTDDGSKIAEARADVADASVTVRLDNLAGIELWDIDQPCLYQVEVLLETAHGSHRLGSTFGFRTCEYTAGGFLLNGRKLKLRGLNRHQAFPYVGYALGRAAQERDAEILKHELHCNIVRTAHYPQSRHFLDACDRLGLLVFEEIPGWQHIGGAIWKAEAVENVRRMIERDWNHPSIVIWGVRINESFDDHDFYAETNKLARALDPTRQTGGVRCITDSEFLEDVYTMNDFILGSHEISGSNRPRTPLRDQKESTGLGRNVPYLVTEYGGHMYPTKSYDQEQRQDEHVRRHLEILNAAYGDPSIAGCIGWCMADYNTHKDFGSGDRICHHGVMDMFREPKFAAYVYASQCEPEEEIVLKPVTYWARGERNIGGVLPLTVLTNCDEVELRFGGSASKRIGPDRDTYPNLPHPPVVFDHRHFSSNELGLWGTTWSDAEIIGFRAGKPVQTIRMTSAPVATRLEVVADRSVVEASGRDSVRIMIRALDQVGNKLPFFDESVAIKISGPGRRIGPELVPLRAGSVGFWLKSNGTAGTITVEVVSARLGIATTAIEARRQIPSV